MNMVNSISKQARTSVPLVQRAGSHSPWVITNTQPRVSARDELQRLGNSLSLTSVAQHAPGVNFLVCVADARQIQAGFQPQLQRGGIRTGFFER